MSKDMASPYRSGTSLSCLKTEAYAEAEFHIIGLARVDTPLLISSSEVGQRATQHLNVIKPAKRARSPALCAEAAAIVALHRGGEGKELRACR